jgi:hypothetical protein
VVRDDPQPVPVSAGAEEVEQSDPAYLAELESWLRTDPAAVDGVPVEAVPSEDPHGRPSNWMIRDFVVGSQQRQRFLPSRDPDAPPPPGGATRGRADGHDE